MPLVGRVHRGGIVAPILPLPLPSSDTTAVTIGLKRGCGMGVGKFPRCRYSVLPEPNVERAAVVAV
jgi:hypothetical protein